MSTMNFLKVFYETFKCKVINVELFNRFLFLNIFSIDLILFPVKAL